MKALFIVNKFFDYFQLLSEEALKQNVDFQITTYDDILIEFGQNRLEVSLDNIPLTNFDLVFFRQVAENLERQIIIASYCKKNNISILDEVFQKSEQWFGSKSYEYMKFSLANIPIIDSCFISKKLAIETVKKVGLPCITKSTTGSQGRGVYLTPTIEDVNQVFQKENKPLMVQTYIPNEGDIRLFVIDNQVVASIKRQSTKEDEFRNNISQGGKAISYDPSQEEITIALAAAKTLGYRLAGVDLVWDKKTKRWLVIEVNRAPQFLGLMTATGVNIPEKIISFLKNYKQRES